MSAFPLLVRFSRRRMAELFGMRAARLYGLGMALSFGVMIALLPDSDSAWAVEKLLVRALVSASWLVAGLAALAAARDLDRKDRDEGVFALVAQRGHDSRMLELSRVLAAAVWIATWVAVPILLLIALAWLKVTDGAMWRWALGWLGFVLVYASALGLVLGTLARTASRLSPERGRIVLVLLVLLPELGRMVWPALPSVPSAFAWALERARTDVRLAGDGSGGSAA